MHGAFLTFLDEKFPATPACFRSFFPYLARAKLCTLQKFSISLYIGADVTH